MLTTVIKDQYVNTMLRRQARIQKKRPSTIARDILLKQLEDAEDYAAAVESMKDPAPSRPIAELWRELGLDD